MTNTVTKFTFPTEIVEYSQTEAALESLRDKYQNAAYNVTTTAGMQEAKEARAEVRGYRTDLEKKRKEIKAPALAFGKLIDSEAKRITAELVKLEEPIDEQIKAYEAELERRRQEKIEAEAKRVSDIHNVINNMKEAVMRVSYMGNPTSEAVAIVFDNLESIEVSDDAFDEFVELAQRTKDEGLATLNELLHAAIQREEEAERIQAERAELDKLRAEAAERERAAQTNIDAEEKRIEKMREEIAAEQNRQAKEKAEREAAEQRAQELARAEEEKAREAAKRAEFPGEAAIIKALAEHFEVSQDVVETWLEKIRNA